MTTENIGLDDVVRLTRVIEDCSTPAEFEAQALPQIATAFASDSAVVLLKQPIGSGRIDFGAGYNFNLATLQSYFHSYRALDPVQTKLEQDLLSAPSARASTEEASTSRDLQRSRYYQEFLRPCGIHRYLCSAWRTAERVVQFGVHRLHVTPDFTPGEYLLSLALMPAISRIFERDLTRARESLFRSVCETLCDALNQRAAVVLNERGDVQFADARASELLALDDGPESEATCASLRRLVRRVRAQVLKCAPRAVAVELQLRSRTYRDAAIRPLPDPSMSLYLLTLERSRVNTEHLSSHLGLSPRGAEIVDLIVAGWTNQQIADRLRLSVNTVRNHISDIYERLSIHGRVELVRLVTRG